MRKSSTGEWFSSNENNYKILKSMCSEEKPEKIELTCIPFAKKEKL